MPARAVITPVARPDPHGGVREPLPPGPPRSKFEAALAYLKNVPQAARIIKWLQNSSAEYKIEIVDREQHPWSSVDSDGFDGLANLVHWDPELAFEGHSGFHLSHAHSAAIRLMHELGHAHHKEVDPTEFFRLVSQPVSDPRWTNLEEKRTILEIENPIAAAFGESQRFFHADSGFHDAQLYATVTPTSTQAAHQNGRFMPLVISAATASEAQQPESSPLLLVAHSVSLSPPQFVPLVISAVLASEAPQAMLRPLLLPTRPISSSPPQFTPLALPAPRLSKPHRPEFLPLPPAGR